MLSDDTSLAEEVLEDVPLVGKSAFLEMRRLTVRLPNGKKSTRDMVRHPGASAMIALNEAGEIILERQWRTPLGRAFWEIPAGKIDAGETAFDCARRELAEEAALRAKNWVHLGTLHNAIGYSNEHIEVYLARDLEGSSQKLDENEFLNLVKLPWKTVLAMCLNGEITDVKTICAMTWLEKYLSGELPQAKVL